MKLVEQIKRLGMISRIRAFTLFPRRFYSHYWYNNSVLHFTRWWQWGRRCFFIRTKTFVRPTFSSWEQIKSRAKIGDKDALLIRRLIERSNQKDLERFYVFVITEVDGRMVE